MTPSLLAARRVRPRPRAGRSAAVLVSPEVRLSLATEVAVPAAANSAAGSADFLAAAPRLEPLEAVAFSAVLAVVRAGRSTTEDPRWCAEIASTRSPLRILEPPVIPSWPARICSWASFRPASPADLAGADVAVVSKSAALGAAAEVTVSVTKDPSPSMAGPIIGAAMISVRLPLLLPHWPCNGKYLRFHFCCRETACTGNGVVHSLNQVSNGAILGSNRRLPCIDPAFTAQDSAGT